MAPKSKLHAIVYSALMAAIVYVLTQIYIPLGESRVHLGNAASMLAGLLLGPWLGGAASAVGAFLFDMVQGYPIVEALVTIRLSPSPCAFSVLMRTTAFTSALYLAPGAVMISTLLISTDFSCFSSLGSRTFLLLI